MLQVPRNKIPWGQVCGACKTSVTTKSAIWPIPAQPTPCTFTGTTRMSVTSTLTLLMQNNHLVHTHTHTQAFLTRLQRLGHCVFLYLGTVNSLKSLKSAIFFHKLANILWCTGTKTGLSHSTVLLILPFTIQRNPLDAKTGDSTIIQSQEGSISPSRFWWEALQGNSILWYGSHTYPSQVTSLSASSPAQDNVTGQTESGGWLICITFNNTCHRNNMP